MSTLPNQANAAGGRGKVVFIAVVVGALCALFVWWYVTRVVAPATTAPAALVPVVVAATDIAPRDLLTAQMLRIDQLAPSQAPSSHITQITDAVGKIALSPIPAGQPLTDNLIAPKGVEMGLSYAIPPQYRAVTVSLDPVSGVAGFLKPGDHVDVLATFDTTNQQSVTRTVLQNVTLLATGSQVLPTQPLPNQGVLNNNGQAVSPSSPESQAQEVPNATVMVTPEDAQKLVLAAAKGKIQLALRPADDINDVPLPPLASSTVTGVAAQSASSSSASAPAHGYTEAAVPPALAPVPAAMAPIGHNITVVEGTDAKTVTVDK